MRVCNIRDNLAYMCICACSVPLITGAFFIPLFPLPLTLPLPFFIFIFVFVFFPFSNGEGFKGLRLGGSLAGKERKGRVLTRGMKQTTVKILFLTKPSNVTNQILQWLGIVISRVTIRTSPTIQYEKYYSVLCKLLRT